MKSTNNTTPKTLTLNVITTAPDKSVTIEQRRGVDLVSAHAELAPINRSTGEQRKIQVDIRNGGEILDVYSLLRAALHIAANSCNKSTDPTLILARCDIARISARLALPEYIDGGAALLLALVNGDIGNDNRNGISAEGKDLFSWAYNGIIDKYAADPAADNIDLYLAGYESVNTYLNKERRNHARETSLEWIKESGGELVKETEYNARIIYGGERYNPAAEIAADITVETRENIAAAVSAAAATLTSKQKQALSLAEKNSYAQIADKMKISKTTAADHVTTARAKVADYILKESPDLIEFVDALPIIEKARAAANRKNGGQARAAENFNAAAENARYTYGKYYKQVETNNLNAAAEHLKNEISAARERHEKAAAAVSAARAAAAVSDLQIARAAAYIKHNSGRNFNTTARANFNRKAREIIAAAYPIASAAAVERETGKALQALKNQLAQLNSPRKKPAKKSRKNSEKSPAPLVKVTI